MENTGSNNSASETATASATASAASANAPVLRRKSEGVDLQTYAAKASEFVNFENKKLAETRNALLAATAKVAALRASLEEAESARVALSEQVAQFGDAEDQSAEIMKRLTVLYECDLGWDHANKDLQERFGRIVKPREPKSELSTTGQEKPLHPPRTRVQISNELEKRVMNLIAQSGVNGVSGEAIYSQLPNSDKETIRAFLNSLRAENRVTTTGEKRGMKYILVSQIPS